MSPTQAKSAGIPRKIVDFHLDEDDEWIAELECGHEQQVRHNPPRMINPWIATPQGRLEHLGCRVACTACATSLLSMVQGVNNDVRQKSGCVEPASAVEAVVLWVEVTSPNKLKQNWAVHVGTRLLFGPSCELPNSLVRQLASVMLYDRQGILHEKVIGFEYTETFETALQPLL